MATYLWKPNVVCPVDAQTVGEELERLRIDMGGRLDAKDVVAAARSHNAPLHRAFEWDDGKAAGAYREEQAKYLIRNVTVSIDENATDKQPIRAFVSVVQDDERRYTSTLTALSEPDLRAQVVARAWSELEAWRRRHAELVELARIFTAMDEARGA